MPPAVPAVKSLMVFDMLDEEDMIQEATGAAV